MAISQKLFILEKDKKMDSSLQQILQEFEAHKGQFVITESWDIERLIAIGDDGQDYYYVTYNGRQTKWNTCVGSIIPLKDRLTQKEYDKFISRAKLNHWDQNVYGVHDAEYSTKHKIEVTQLNKYLTQICWDLN